MTLRKPRVAPTLLVKKGRGCGRRDACKCFAAKEVGTIRTVWRLESHLMRLSIAPALIAKLHAWLQGVEWDDEQQPFDQAKQYDSLTPVPITFLVALSKSKLWYAQIFQAKVNWQVAVI